MIHRFNRFADSEPDEDYIDESKLEPSQQLSKYETRKLREQRETERGGLPG